MKRIILFLSVLFLGLLVVTSCGDKKPEAVGQEQTVAPDRTVQTSTGGDEFTFIFYADTRGDPRFTNWFQVLHKKFIKKILENEKDNGIRHLVFGGDNVLMGFLNCLWKRFFEVMEPFDEQQIKIYPAIGNHELWLSRLGLATLRVVKKKEVKDTRTAEVLDLLRNRMANRDELKKLLEDEEFLEKLLRVLELEMEDPTFETEHKAFVERLEKEFNVEGPTDIFKEIAEIYAIAQEASLYKIRRTLHVAGDPSPDWDRFKKYVDAWPHLKKIDSIQQEKTWYSFVLPDEDNPRIKIIALDSNIKNNAEQKAWYENELKANFDGPVMVTCHHPLFCSDWFNWEIPPHLVLVGHVHDYERLSQAETGDSPPIYIISGSGGAYLKTSKKAHCLDDKTWVHQNWFNYVRITVTPTKIRLTVFGCKKMKDPLTQIEELEFGWKKPATP